MSYSAGDNPNKILSILATINPYAASLTAVFALAVSVYAGYSTRQHDRLSVKPLLQIINQTDSTGESENGLILSNEGVGPALVKSWKIIFNKKSMGESKKGWDNVRGQLGWPDWIRAADHIAIRAGQTLPIFYVAQTDWIRLSDPERQKFYNAVKQMEVYIDYESIYGNRDQCRFALGPQAGDN